MRVLRSLERTEKALRGIQVAKSAIEGFLEDRDGFQKNARGYFERTKMAARRIFEAKSATEMLLGT